MLYHLYLYHQVSIVKLSIESTLSDFSTLLLLDIHKSAKDFPPHIPLKMDEYVDVTVTHIVDCKHIYVQRVWMTSW